VSRVAIAFVIGLLIAGPVLASDRDDIMAVLKQWNAGEAVCAEDAAVVDAIPPFEWHGPGACTKWKKDSDAYDQQQGATDATGTIGEPQQLIISGDRAYVVLPATYAFTKVGKRVNETATATLVLHKSGAGWRITAWTWGMQTAR
jgi:hypothetical protein